MDPFIIGSLIGGGSSLLGGLMGNRAANKANQQNMYLAKHGVSLRVADAKRAGIHPLAALGMNPIGPVVQPNFALGDAVASAGEQIGSAIANRPSREAAELGLEREQLTNQLLRAQIAQTNAGTGSMLAEATSRSAIAAARSAAVGGTAPTPSPTGPWPAYNPSVGVVRPTGEVPPRPGTGTESVRGPNVTMHTGLGPVEVNPGRTPAEELEAMYGEAADLVGAANLLWDYYQTNVGRPFVRAMRATGRGYSGGSAVPEGDPRDYNLY